MVKKIKNELVTQRWSRNLLRVSLFSFYAAFSFSSGISNAVPITKLEDWRFNPQTLQLEINLSTPLQPRYFYLSNPPRIVVDLPATQLGYVSTRQDFSGTITSIRVSQFNADITRIVMDLAPGTFLDPSQVQIQPVSWQKPTRWILRPLISANPSLVPKNFSPSPVNLPASQGLYTPPPSSPGFDNSPKTPANLPSPPSFYNPPPSTGDLPPTSYNSSQPPFVTVPPLVPNNPSQLPNSVLPPAIFPNQSINPNNIPFFPTPNYPVPTIPNNQPIYPDSQIIEFGQPLPKRNQ